MENELTRIQQKKMIATPSLIARLCGIVCIIAGTGLYIYSQHLPAVYYCYDTVRGAIASKWAMYEGSKASGEAIIRYQRVPSKADPAYIRAGHFLFFMTPENMSIRAIALKVISHTSFYTIESLSNAIQRFNAVSAQIIPKDTLLFIPSPLPPYMKVPHNNQLPAIPKTIGIYYTGHVIGKESTLGLIEKYRAAGVNTIVFDAKDITGIANYRSAVPLVVQHNLHEKAPIGNIDFLIRFLKERGIYTIARIAVFHDHLLYKKVPEYAIRTADGKPWNSDSNELWCDPTNRHVQNYAIALAEELADKGVDEIQFDYIRFPTKGGLSRAALAHHDGRKAPDEVIEHFLSRAHEVLSAKNVRLSVDLFGIVAWGKEIDVRKTGQRIERLAKFCDAISPMLYPSHFNDDFDGYKNPGDNPYYFIFEGTKKFKSLANGTIIRPWLQAFRWRVSSYNEKYIIEQIRASDDAGGYGYLFWNASNNYETVFAALLSMNSKEHAQKKSDAKPQPRNNNKKTDAPYERK